MTEQLSENAAKWAAERGLSASTLARLGVASGTVSMPPDGRKCEVIAFPYRRGGEAVNAKYRTIEGKQFRQREGGEQRFWNLDAVLNGRAESVYIVEGEIDACALVEAGIPVEQVLSVPNGAPEKPGDNPEEQDRYRYVREALTEGLSRFKRFVILTDADAPGRALRQDLVRLIGAARSFYADWPEGTKDADEALIQWGAEGLRRFVEDAPQEWPVAGLYRLSELPEPEPMTIWRPGFPEWENKLAFAPETVSAVTGQPGHGKSTLMAEIWFRIARQYELVVAMASFETRAKPHHRRNIRQFMYGTLDGNLTPDQIVAADEWNDAHFRWIVHPNRRPSLRWLLDMAEVAVVRSNARALVIDPWNRLEHERPPGMSETEYISRALDELLDFARDMRCHVQVIAHPAKAMSPDQRRHAPVLEDIAGSKAWDTKVDLGLSIHRPVVFKDGLRQTEAVLHVLKSRYDELGYPCELNIDLDLTTGCFRSTDYAARWQVA